MGNTLRKCLENEKKKGNHSRIGHLKCIAKSGKVALKKVGKHIKDNPVNSATFILDLACVYSPDPRLKGIACSILPFSKKLAYVIK